ncbi:hypothetical protein NQ318_023486 [Aromia moschata]|uniref:Large ribosomal subunit protein eL28 n=1 Tax=Aromia moschata TaxID=1265417 RepID=A0AAV8YN50_9CUCU|nr:hypothetical protein NQ318_023486 [Aromia moschata]
MRQRSVQFGCPELERHIVFYEKFTMSSHLVWGIIRNNNAFLLKKRNISKPFSTESNNLTNVNSYRYNGLIHKKTVGIVDASDKKGFTVVYKKASKQVKLFMYILC